MNATIITTAASIRISIASLGKLLSKVLIVPILALSVAGCNGQVFSSMVAGNKTQQFLPFLLIPTVQSIDIVTPTTLPLPLGMERQLQVRATYSDGSQLVMNANQVSWSSEDDTKLSVTNGGIAKGLDVAGTYSITAIYNGISASLPINLSGATVIGLTVNADKTSIAKGEVAHFTATATLSDGTTLDITNNPGLTWSASPSSGVTVDYGSNKGYVKGDVAGTSTTITASYEATPSYGVYTNTSPLSVTAAVLQSIAISASSSSIPKGVYLQFTAIGNYTDGARDITTQATWNSSATAFSDFDDPTNNPGRVWGKAVGGPAVITATLAGVTSNDANLTVTDAELQSITINSSGTS